MNRPRSGRLRRLVRAAMALAIAMPSLIAPTPAVAAGSYVGGAAPDSAVVIPNDHTPIAVRYSASGLAPNTRYRLKVRLSPAPEPMNIQNRGWTWNPETRQWVQEREQDKDRFPAVTADASGRIDNAWAYYKFGDEAKSGTYYLLISLNQQQGATYNGAQPLQLTVIDMKTQGARLHNGTATGLGADTRVSVITQPSNLFSASAETTVVMRTRTEPNRVDDDGDGRVDNENRGPAGAVGDYLLTAPVNARVDVVANDETPVRTSVMLTNPDEDVALGASDMRAPSAPASLTAIAADRRITLRWRASTDNVGVTRYRIYRWAEPPAGVPYSAPKILVGTSATTAYIDRAIARSGIEYRYEVRAADAATNESARSNTAGATSIVTPPVARASVIPARANGLRGWYVRTAPRVALTASIGRAYYSWDSSTSAFATYTVPVRAPQGARRLFFYAQDSYGNASDIGSILARTDTLRPRAVVTAPAIASQVSASNAFPVSWSAIDGAGSSGGMRYDVEYRTSDTAAWRRWRTSTASTQATMTGALGATYRFRARARDAAGNLGAWSAVRTTIVPLDETSGRYTGPWSRETSVTSYRGASRVTTEANSAATFILAKGASQAFLITMKGPDRSPLIVYVNGRRTATVSLYSETEEARVTIPLGSLSRTRVNTIRLVAMSTTALNRLDIDGLAVRR